MSDELVDGRDLRNRKPVHDNEADAAESEDRAPLPRNTNPYDQPSGPYVVLEPPPEARPATAPSEPSDDQPSDTQPASDMPSDVPDETPVREMRVRALIAQPTDGAVLAAGEQLVRGIAWSGAGRIAAVEVSIDDGTDWRRAGLTQPRATSAPALWSFSWDAAPGDHTIMARAIDDQGNIQPLDARNNRLGYGNNIVHRIHITVR